MFDAQVTDAGVAELRGLQHLTYVHVSNAGIGDDALEILGTLTQLKGLSLQGNRFSDRGIAHLAKRRHRRAHDVVWVVRSQRLGENIAHSRGLEHCSNGPSCDDARSR